MDFVHSPLGTLFWNFRTQLDHQGIAREVAITLKKNIITAQKQGIIASMIKGVVFLLHKCFICGR